MAAAAAGSPIILGSPNDAGIANTTIKTNSSGMALQMNNLGTGVGGYMLSTGGVGLAAVTSSKDKYGGSISNQGASAGTGAAVLATGKQNTGLVATTENAAKYAIDAVNGSGTAVYAKSLAGTAVHALGSPAVVAEGSISAISATASDTAIEARAIGYDTDYGIWAKADALGTGVYGQGQNGGYFVGTKLGDHIPPGPAVVAGAVGGDGPFGRGNGVEAEGGQYGVFSEGGFAGVHGRGPIGVQGNWGLDGEPLGPGGVEGAGTDVGMFGVSPAAVAIWASSSTGTVLVASQEEYVPGDYALIAAGDAQVEVNLDVTGTVTKAAGSFKIDHPLDPANKYLFHSFVESPDMKNVYDGVAKLDATGEATGEMPEWFEALNSDVRHQLKPIGMAAPELHIRSGVKGNRFVVAGGSAGQAVSWQVTGIRKDAYAKAHPVPVEVAKEGQEMGCYLHPKEHGKPASKGIAKLHERKLPSPPSR